MLTMHNFSGRMTDHVTDHMMWSYDHMSKQEMNVSDVVAIHFWNFIYFLPE